MAAEMSSEPRQPNRFEKKKNNSHFTFRKMKRPGTTFRSGQNGDLAQPITRRMGGLEPWPTPGKR